VTAAALVTFCASPAAFALPGSPEEEPGRAESLPPTLTPADGAYLEGTVTVVAVPMVADDDVTSLTIDGAQLAATETVGVSHLAFDVGRNSTEARYHNYVLVNGAHRIDLGDAVVEERRIAYVAHTR
jgi:hypothetical protein